MRRREIRELSQQIAVPPNLISVAFPFVSDEKKHRQRDR